MVIPEPRFQGGQPFNLLTFMSLSKNNFALWREKVDVVSKTFDVRNYSEIPRYPNGDFSKFCCGDMQMPPSPWEERLRLDVIKAPAFVGKTDLPVIFYVHPGGYTGGDRTWVTELLHVLPQGYAIVSISYRFLHHGYMAGDMLVDISDAFEWVVLEGPTYGLDPSRVLIVGMSAGGHLALLSSFILNEKYPGRIRMVLSVSGPTEFLWLYKSELRESYDERIFELFTKVANITGSDDPEFDAKLNWITPSSHLNNVNFSVVTVHGMSDWLIPHEMSVIFHQKLQDMQIPNYLLSVPTNGHSSLILSQYTIHILERSAARFLL